MSRWKGLRAVCLAHVRESVEGPAATSASHGVCALARRQVTRSRCGGRGRIRAAMTNDLRRISWLVLVCGLGCGQTGGTATAPTGSTTGGEATATTTTGGDTTAAPTSSSTTAEPTTGEPDPCAASPQALADCVDPAAYAEDLQFIADVRTPGTPHWQAVQDLCADRLSELGYEVALMDYGSGVN